MVLHNLHFCYAYTDDLIIASHNAEEHETHLQLILQRLGNHSIVIHPSKSEFGIPTLPFLGHQVDSTDICPLYDKVKAIRDFPQLTRNGNYKSLVNFYHQFLPHCAAILQHLNNKFYWHGQMRKTKPIHGPMKQPSVFSSIKEALANAILLVHPHTDATTSITMDASDTSIRAVPQ